MDNIDNSSSCDGMSDGPLTEATEKLADATIANQNIANAINTKRVKISHERYVELQNKRLYLHSFKSWLDDYSTLIYRAFLAPTYDKWIESAKFSTSYESLINGIPSTPLVISKGEIKVVFDTRKKSVDVLCDNEVLPFTYPDKVVETKGEVNINGNEYNKYLHEETLYHKYIDLLHNIESFMYSMIFNKSISPKGSPTGHKLLKMKDDLRGYKSSIEFNDDFIIGSNNKYIFIVNHMDNTTQLRILT